MGGFPRGRYLFSWEWIWLVSTNPCCRNVPGWIFFFGEFIKVIKFTLPNFGNNIISKSAKLSKSAFRLPRLAFLCILPRCFMNNRISFVFQGASSVHTRTVLTGMHSCAESINTFVTYVHFRRCFLFQECLPNSGLEEDYRIYFCLVSHNYK